MKAKRKSSFIVYDYYINNIYQVSGTREQICKQLNITRQALKSRIFNSKRNEKVKHVLVEKEQN